MNNVYKKLEKIINKLDPIEFHGATLYEIDKEILKELLLLQTEDTSKRKNKYFKILNTKKAIKYKFYLRKTPRIIVDKQKVREYLQKEFNLYKNVLLKSVEESIIENNLSEKDASNLRKRVNMQILEGEQKLKELIINYEEYEIIITNYKDARYYPAIHFTTEDKKHKADHLTTRTPNFLYYEEESCDTNEKSTAYIKKFIKNSKLLGNTIYYRKK